ncbi:hypothetical protein ACFFWC_27390 [Plantactinospora siamensis]|uniref:VCBS repeat-containing protein n=1 Tax=Plantactinospora siamensis TaxID=555372 RepID=A0ABV6NXN6_9ACTN
MSIRVRAAALLTALATAAALGVPVAARAGAVNQPIVADLTGDGLVDEAFLGATAPNYCSVILFPGAPPGLFVPPSAYVYLRPVRNGGPEVCPDVGTAFDWDGDGANELWIGWSRGQPATLSYNRLILDDGRHGFRPLSAFLSPVTPVLLDTAVFTPGGVPTPYSLGRGGFAPYIFHGTVVELGPQRWCSTYTPGLRLRDLNGNGAVDALLAYRQGCTDHANGVVVILDNGHVQQLERGTATWTATFVFANADRIADVRTRNQVTGRVRYFIGRGDGTFAPALAAGPNTVTAEPNRVMAGHGAAVTIRTNG